MSRYRMGLLSAVALSAMAFVGTGCQNKVKEENDKLWLQNRELQAENEGLRAGRGSVEPPPAAEPVKPAAVVPTAPPPPVVVVPPPPAVSPTPPPVVPDLGGETSVDPTAGTTTVNFVGDALFDSGQATLKASSKTALNKLVAGLKAQYAGKPVKVQGHTDADPIRASKWKSNQELSEARAKAVHDYLVTQGVEASRVSTEGFGASKPKSTDPKQKAANRRVEIVVLTR